MASSTVTPPPGLYEFLEEAELTHFFNGLTNVLQIQNIQQLKYVVNSAQDLHSIGMSKTEARRLKTAFHKHNSNNFQSNNSGISKLKKLLRSKRNDQNGTNKEFLLASSSASTASTSTSPSPMMLTTSEQQFFPTSQSTTNVPVPAKHNVIPFASISIHKELGVGEFGVVQQGVWTDENQMTHQVAIKCLSKERMQNNTVEFKKESDIMYEIDHPHIVRLFGVVLDSPQIMMVTELAPLRSLLECLKEPSLRKTFNVPRLSGFCRQIVDGMAYLEEKRFIHRDLAARNILVFSKDVVKVSDFGLSRALGVGKDYYQTNFNANLKLPIAWCAPECINFLKFTSASDVWAFAVTMWEMFTYGFQPWAAQTGQQILEAIDEPNCQRLEQPVYCPKDHYAIMHSCWKHEPSKRPTFKQLAGILEEARPEQVKAIISNPSCGSRGALDYIVGDVITVLEKPEDKESDELWRGCLNNGKVGVFNPNHTVAYIGTLPTSNVNKWLKNDEKNSFQRSSLRGSKKKKISVDMISGPRGHVHHTGHVGVDGAFFGDVVGFGNHPSERGDFNSMPSLSRADSDVSERAPLIGGTAPDSRNGSTSSGDGLTTVDGGANKNPRMVYATGYLRNSNQDHNVFEGGKQEKHEYQSISGDEADNDNAFATPLDLGPSLMDEVFNELDSSLEEARKNACIQGILDDVRKNNELQEQQQQQQQEHGTITDELKDLVFSTLTLYRHKNRHKKQATVKPINAKDEKTLESAIAMANALASKSMHELDKRCTEDFYDNSPVPSPLTPNSPSKKFHFWFPSKSSPKSDRRHYSEEANAGGDIESSITPSAKDAYNALIGGTCTLKSDSSSPPPLSSTCFKSCTSLSPSNHRFSLPPSSSVFAASSLSLASAPPTAGLAQTPPGSLPPPLSQVSMSQSPLFTSNGQTQNPLPLPPKSIRANQPPPKRHVRKNPLIIPSGTAANLLRREAVSDTNHFDLQVEEPPCSGNNNYSSYNKLHDHHRSSPLPPPSPLHKVTENEDDFEEAIACSMDALDNITDIKYNSPKHSLDLGKPEDSLPLVQYNQDHVSCEDLLEFRRNRLEESDEVRIMKKVLGRDMISTDKAIVSLNVTEWNVHRAIKLVKIKNLIKAPGISDNEMKQALMSRDWDVAKAANILMKKIKQ